MQPQRHGQEAAVPAHLRQEASGDGVGEFHVLGLTQEPAAVSIGGRHRACNAVKVRCGATVIGRPVWRGHSGSGHHPHGAGTLALPRPLVEAERPRSRRPRRRGGQPRRRGHGGGGHEVGQGRRRWRPPAPASTVRVRGDHLAKARGNARRIGDRLDREQGVGIRKPGGAE